MIDRVLAAAAAAVAIGFGLGSIPFGVVVARRRGIDLKRVGSGNIGATNAARALGKKTGAVVLLLDTVKAFAPTYAARLVFAPAGERGYWIAAAVGFAAFLGHIFSPWLRFRGGKGVACGLGAFLALAPVAAAAALVVCAVVVAATRVGALGSLAGSLALLPALWWLHAPTAQLALAGAMFVLILWRHRENLDRLRQGRENRF